MKSSSTKEVLKNRQRRLPADGCDRAQVWQVLGTHDYAIAGLAAISDADQTNDQKQTRRKLILASSPILTKLLKINVSTDFSNLVQ